MSKKKSITDFGEKEWAGGIVDEILDAVSSANRTRLSLRPIIELNGKGKVTSFRDRLVEWLVPVLRQRDEALKSQKRKRIAAGAAKDGGGRCD